MTSHLAGPPGFRSMLHVCAVLCLLQARVGHAQSAPPNPSEADVQALHAQIAEYQHRLEEMRKRLEEDERGLRALQRQVEARAAPAASAASAAEGVPGHATASAAPVTPTAAGVDSGQPQAAQQPTAPVGRAPEAPTSPPPVANLFEQPGVLTPRGHAVLEPALQYSYSSNNRVALIGYTIIPALVVGLIDVREVKSNILTAAMTGRWGVTNRLELETRVPYVYRADDTISRSVGTGAASDSVFSARGHALGDVEVAGRYQLNEGSASLPYFVASMRYKTRTGRSPFEVVTDCQTVCAGTNVTGTGLPLSEPTGSGFDSLQGGLTWLLPSDPAVLFGNFSYLHNFRRDVTRRVLNGESEHLGIVDPGDVIGFNFGMGLALNERSSFSIGYDHASVAATKENGVRVPGSVRLELGTLVLGYSLRLTPATTVNLSVGAGLTRDTPDLTLTLRVPFLF